jgi:hypothetical protein
MRFKGFKTGSFISVGNRGLNPTISLASTRRVNNPVWNFAGPHTFQGTVAGYASGVSPPAPPGLSNAISKFPFASDANATDVGDLSVSRRDGSGQSSDVSGYTSGGTSAPNHPLAGGNTNVIDKFPFASNGNATDVGDLLSIMEAVGGGQSSTVSGYVSGGFAPTAVAPPGGLSNVIQKFPFATNANATDVGDLTFHSYYVAGQSSTVSGYTSSRNVFNVPPPGNSSSNIIDKFPFATDANATDVGDLSVTRRSAAGQSSTVSGYASGGNLPTNFRSNTIDKFPFAADANATDVGDLTVVRSSASGQSSTVSGYASGGVSGSNVIDKFPFATDANATDVGDLSVVQELAVGQQD